MNTLERHTQEHENNTTPRLDADFWLYRTLWVELDPIRATMAFWCVRIFGGRMYGKRRHPLVGAYAQEKYMRQCSKERGCDGKTNLGSQYKKQADRMSEKHGKAYGVYLCPHCGGTHLTTKLENAAQYAPLLYTSKPAEKKDLFSLAHELWAVAQVMPHEGIEDAVLRIVDLLKTNMEETSSGLNGVQRNEL